MVDTCRAFQVGLYLIVYLLMSTGLTFGILVANSEAQIALDGSLGVGGGLNGPNYVIPANVGQLCGSNLFHSFSQFNLATDESATFTGPITIANIISRITGGQPSAINGILRTEIPGVDLFLLNPNGVVFGPDASLDVGGSVHVSTSEFLRFTDGTQFSADAPNGSKLTVAAPAAFGFLRADPTAIDMAGSQLSVASEETLSIVAGDLEIADSVLEAPRGRVVIASVGSAGEVVPFSFDQSPVFDVSSFDRLGRVTISQGLGA